MTRKNAVRLTSFLLALSVVSLGAAVSGWVQANEYRRYLEYSDQRAFSDLVTSVSNLDSALQKGVYANSPSMISSLSAQIWRESSNAKASLAQMPLNDINLEKTQKFISQAGEYAYTILRKSSSGETLSEEDRKRIVSLAETADQLASQLLEVKQQYDGGTLKLRQNKTGGSFSASAAEAESGSVTFDSVEEEFPEYATLIYDGPYSDHIEKMEPLFIKGKEAVSTEQAKKTAAQFLNINIETLKADGETEGKIPTYRFTVPDGDGEIAVEITKAGGYILQAVDSRAGGEKKLSAEEAVKKAAAMLASLGYRDMKESYYTEYESIVTVNFAATENDVILYPDLIKVAVSLNDGTLRSIDAYGYIMNHRQRSLSAPTVSMDAAAKNVNHGLKIISSSYALIPTNGQNEVFCHEFKCENADGRHYIIYVNAKTGMEETIFILLEDENGTLAI